MQIACACRWEYKIVHYNTTKHFQKQSTYKEMCVNVLYKQGIQFPPLTSLLLRIKASYIHTNAPATLITASVTAQIKGA